MNFINDEQLQNLSEKKELSIVITDSGLGGLSICAEAVEGLKQLHSFEKINLTYYNAWPEQNRGYNRLGNNTERTRVFNKALEGMLQYKPDIILIACNTLSVLYNETSFSRETTIPVVDIVDFGVSIIDEYLVNDRNSKALILGTITTVETGEHKKRLVDKNIEENRIISQACDQLATNIEKGPASETVVQLVETFMEEAAGKIGSSASNICTALCCTHFGYSAHSIKEKLQSRVSGRVDILNPNKEMAAFLVSLCDMKTHHSPEKKTRVTIRIVSRIKWDEEKVGSISAITRDVSPETAHALEQYEWIPDLFSF
ncbi:MAG: hypothetical protein GY754_19005 [bacterium]|nr:hypothetical protein [bacterium]